MTAMQVHTLTNGLRVCIDPMDGIETVALGVWAHAGSENERENEHGLAHLLEHMAFKGTQRRSARDISEEIENVGGHLNAATSHQRTGYYVRLLRDDIALGVDILGDILLAPNMSDADLTREKDVVLQEIGEAADIPDDVLFEQLQMGSWGSQSLGRPILGTPQSVQDQSSDSLRDFMGRWYQPENMVVAVSGAVEPASFLQLVRDTFGHVVNKATPQLPGDVNFVGDIRHDPREIEQTHLAVSFPGVASNDQKFFATRLFTDVLGGGMSSRLFQKIREERGLAYSVYSFADGYERCGLTGAYLGADSTDIVEAAKHIRGEIEAMSVSIEQREVDRARAMLKSSMMMSLENPGSRIEAAAGQLFGFQRLVPKEEIVDRLNRVSVDDVRQCAGEALCGAFSLAVVGPGDIDRAAEIFQA